MKSLYKYKDTSWTDLSEPKADEIAEIANEYGISKAVSDSLLAPSPRHLVEFADGHAYLVLHFPAFKDMDGDDAAFELDFVIGDDFLITAHYGTIGLLNTFKATIESALSSEPGGNVRDLIFFGLLKTLISDFDQKLSKVDHWVRDLEKNMFSGKEKNTIFELSEASRHLIDFKKIVAVYPESFKDLAEKGSEAFGSEFGDQANEVLESFNKLQTKLDLLSEAVHELRETNDSLVSTKQSESMRILSIVMVIATVLVGAALVWVGLHTAK